MKYLNYSSRLILIFTYSIGLILLLSALITGYCLGGVFPNVNTAVFWVNELMYCFKDIVNIGLILIIISELVYMI